MVVNNENPVDVRPKCVVTLARTTPVGAGAFTAKKRNDDVGHCALAVLPG